MDSTPRRSLNDISHASMRGARAAFCGGEDRDIGSEIGEHAGPVAGRVLEEHGPVGEMKEEDERAAVAAVAVTGHRAEEMVDGDRFEFGGQVGGQFGQARFLLL